MQRRQADEVARVSAGEVVAAAAAAVLLAGMFLDWFGVEVTTSRIRGAEGLADQAGGVNAWQAFGVTDIVLFAGAVLALAPLAARLTGGLPRMGVHPGLLVAVAGAVATVTGIIAVADPPIEKGTFAGGIVAVAVERETGAWVSLAACAAIVAGGLLWARKPN